MGLVIARGDFRESAILAACLQREVRLLRRNIERLMFEREMLISVAIIAQDRGSAAVARLNAAPGATA
jgi:hypothetical protein